MDADASPPTSDAIRSARFRREREADWRRLEALVARSEQRGPKSLSFQDAADLARLYRQTVASLSVARSISLDRALLAYLEALTARAYLVVYAPAESLAGLLGRFFRHGAPAAVRQSFPFIVLAFATLAAGIACGAALFSENAAWYDVFVPRSAGDIRGPNATAEQLKSVIYPSEAGNWGGLAAFASALFSNNTQVAVFAFSLGVFGGLLTFLLVFFNGLVIGALVALHVERGLGYDIFGWLSVHGVTELGAIVIAAAGGYLLGSAVLFPGRFTRAAALRRVAGTAAKLALVAALMLFAAAGLEAFARERILDTQLRLLIGWGFGVLWLMWFASGRRPSTTGPRR